jgi:hypothetical protein
MGSGEYAVEQTLNAAFAADEACGQLARALGWPLCMQNPPLTLALQLPRQAARERPSPQRARDRSSSPSRARDRSSSPSKARLSFVPKLGGMTASEPAGCFCAFARSAFVGLL